MSTSPNGPCLNGRDDSFSRYPSTASLRNTLQFRAKRFANQLTLYETLTL
jgi:hypothetical protein